jgi:hypothetical protein
MKKKKIKLVIINECEINEYNLYDQTNFLKNKIKKIKFTLYR